jgi:23S rRNA (cytosine1962-C5)-methyltransferase
MIPRILLKRGKERPVLGGHPWVFSGAIERVEGAADGDTVDICAKDGAFIARGYYNSRSQIAARVWTLDPRPVDAGFLAERVESAIATRRRLGLSFRDQHAPTNAFRLVNAECDGLPGLVVDAYGAQVVLQILTAGMDRFRPALADLLDSQLHPEGLYERSDTEARDKEGLARVRGLVRGRELPSRVEIKENGLSFLVDVAGGHKTGFYLDQRENRGHLEQILGRWSTGSRASSDPFAVLNSFAYTGAFGVYACRARPDAQITNLDSSADLLDLGRENFARNGCLERAEFVAGDAFHELRRFRDQGRRFDAVILDPPKFAYSQGHVTSACRGYKDLNLLAFKLLRPGGLLVTFSCSGLVGRDLFQKVVFDAARDAGRDGRILARLGHAPDHPLLLSFPEGEYLKGLAVEVVDWG